MNLTMRVLSCFRFWKGPSPLRSTGNTGTTTSHFRCMGTGLFSSKTNFWVCQESDRSRSGTAPVQYTNIFVTSFLIVMVTIQSPMKTQRAKLTLGTIQGQWRLVIAFVVAYFCQYFTQIEQEIYMHCKANH